MNSNTAIDLLLNIKIDLWLILLVSLVIILIVKIKLFKELFKKIKRHIKRFSNWIWNLIKKIAGYLKNKLEQVEFSKPSEDKQLFVLFVLIISILLAICFNVIPEIFNRNLGFEPDLKNTFLIVSLIAFLIVWVIILLISTSGRYSKELSLWLISGIIFYFVFKFPNNNKLIVAMIFIIPLIVIRYLYKPNENQRKSRIWMMATVVIMIFCFLGGSVLIDTVYGYKPISLYLNLDGNVSQRYMGNGTLECYNPAGKIITNKILKCNITPPLENITNFTVSITYDNQSMEIISLDNLTLKVNDKTRNVYFEITGIDSKGKKLFLSTGSSYKFYSLEEQNDREKQFITIFLALIAVIAFSIPTMMVNLRDLSKPETLKQY